MSELFFFGNYDVKETEKPMIPPNYINLILKTKDLIGTKCGFVPVELGTPLTVNYNIKQQDNYLEYGNLHIVVGYDDSIIKHISTNLTGTNEHIKFTIDEIICAYNHGRHNLNSFIDIYSNEKLVNMYNGISFSITDNISNDVTPELTLTFKHI